MSGNLERSALPHFVCLFPVELFFIIVPDALYLKKKKNEPKYNLEDLTKAVDDVKAKKQPLFPSKKRGVKTAKVWTETYIHR